MLRANQVSVHEVRKEEENSVIPLASFGDKLLTVSSDSVYTLSKDGSVVKKTTNLIDAIEFYNSVSAPKKLSHF